MKKIFVIGPMMSGKTFLTNIYLNGLGMHNGVLNCMYLHPSMTKKYFFRELERRKVQALVIDDIRDYPYARDFIENLSSFQYPQYHLNMVIVTMIEEPEWLKNIEDAYIVKLTAWK